MNPDTRQAADDLIVAYAKLKRERDELLRCAKEALEAFKNSKFDYEFKEWFISGGSEKLEKAIAQTKQTVRG